jgi:hypothetical protein
LASYPALDTCRPCTAMQDRKSGADRPAGGPTAAEFAEKVLGPTVKAAKAKLKNHPSISKGTELLFSYDSARIHTSAMKLVDAASGKLLLETYGFKDAQRLLLPTYSPDMHRVIEHTHGTAVVQFERWLYQNPQKCTMQEYKQAFEAIYRKCCSASAIAADVAGLPELYNWIYEHDGNWAPNRLR